MLYFTGNGRFPGICLIRCLFIDTSLSRARNMATVHIGLLGIPTAKVRENSSKAAVPLWQLLLSEATLKISIEFHKEMV